MKIGIRAFCSVLLALVAATVSADSATQDDATVRAVEDGSYTFDDSVDIQLVNLEVYVTDRKGRPVAGLTAEDFEVREDGRQVSISHFAELQGGAATAMAQIKPRSSDGSAAPEVVLDQIEQPPHLVVYIDNQHLRPAGRKRVLEDLRGYLEKETIPAERVMVMSQSPTLKTEVAFGSSQADLQAALTRLQKSPSLGRGDDQARRLLMIKLSELWEQAESVPFMDPCQEMASAGLREVQSYARGVQGSVGTTLGHLANITSALSGIPGVKSVIYVSDGLELLPGSDLIHFLGDLCPHITTEVQHEAYNHDMSKRFERLTQHANANRVTFYPLEAIGLRGSSSVNAELNFQKFTPSAANDQIRTANVQNSLAFMASSTGGRASFNRNRWSEELEEIVEGMESYYSIAYSPSHSGDDRTHLIDVLTPKHKKLRLRYRSSYRDKPADERMADRLQTALTLGRTSNPLAARVDHGEIVANGKGKTLSVPLRVTVPLSKLVFLPAAGKRVGHLRMQLSARDDEGRVTAFHQKRFEVELAAHQGDPPTGEHSFVINIEMRPGDHVVAVGLRDETGRETSYLASKMRVEVSAPAASVGASVD